MPKEPPIQPTPPTRRGFVVCPIQPSLNGTSEADELTKKADGHLNTDNSLEIAMDTNQPRRKFLKVAGMAMAMAPLAVLAPSASASSMAQCPSLPRLKRERAE